MALSSNGSPLWLHSPQVPCCRRSGSIPSGDRQKPFNGDKSIGHEALALVTTSACKWDHPTESSAPFPRWLLLLLLLVASGLPACADQNYSQQVFFENSLSPGNYFYSSGQGTTFRGHP
jgi:hypothetical protein